MFSIRTKWQQICNTFSNNPSWILAPRLACNKCSINFSYYYCWYDIFIVNKHKMLSKTYALLKKVNSSSTRWKKANSSQKRMGNNSDFACSHSCSSIHPSDAAQCLEPHWLCLQVVASYFSIIGFVSLIDEPMWGMIHWLLSMAGEGLDLMHHWLLSSRNK